MRFMGLSDVSYLTLHQRSSFSVSTFLNLTFIVNPFSDQRKSSNEAHMQGPLRGSREICTLCHIRYRWIGGRGGDE